MEKIKDYSLRAERIQLAPSRKHPLTQVPFSFQLPDKKLISLIGPNGSGKTTLLKALLGEPVLSGGQLFFKNHSASVDKLSAAQLAEHVAYVPQEHFFPKELSLGNFLRLAFLGKARLFGRLPQVGSPPIQEALKRFHLLNLQSQKLGSLSTGERQRVFLARAVLQRPSLLLMDEPTNHLDPGGVRLFWQTLLEEIAGRGMTVLLSTHDLSFVEKHCDWVIALKAGSLFLSLQRSSYLSSPVRDLLFT